MVRVTSFEYQKLIAGKEAKDPQVKKFTATEKKERDLQIACQSWLNDRQIWWKHDKDSRRERIGIPDLIICYKGEFVAVELKVKGAKLKKEQMMELARIRKAGGRTFVARSLEEFVYKLTNNIHEKHPR